MDTQKIMSSDTILQALVAAYGGKERLVGELLKREQGCKKPVTEEQLKRLGEHLRDIQPVGNLSACLGPQVTEVRPMALECDVVRFQNNKEKWVALVGLLDGYPYEIFTGLQDDDEGIVLPKSVTKGKIVKQTNPDGSKRMISSLRIPVAIKLQ